MASLNISKVAVSCASLETLARRQQARARDGVVPIYTRFRPKRADELIGGSLFWIIKHRIVARQTIISFEDSGADRKTVIRLDARLIPVRPYPKRAHQGWRYLSESDAPCDLDALETESDEMPSKLLGELASLALI